MYGNYSHFMKFPTGFGGAPGHSGSTSMSPSAALPSGKPMESHPSYTDTPGSAPRTLGAVGTPLAALGSPYRVITSAMGPPSGALAAPPGVNLVAPPSSQLNVVNSAGLSEDIKPLPGLPGIGNMNYPSSSPGSLVKHICAICGDRSSGLTEYFLLFLSPKPQQNVPPWGVPRTYPATWLLSECSPEWFANPAGLAAAVVTEYQPHPGGDFLCWGSVESLGGSHS